MESPDNIIHWTFEKMFIQLTNRTKNLLTMPFDSICKKTFHCDRLHQTIAKLTSRPITAVRTYLANHTVIKRFLGNSLQRPIWMEIILGCHEKVFWHIHRGIGIDDECYKLAIFNGHLDILKLLESYSNQNPGAQLLYWAVEVNQVNIYFHLRSKGIRPNLSVYNHAVLHSDSMEIIQDIAKFIAPNSETVANAFQSSSMDVTKYILQEYQANTKRPLTNLVNRLIVYPIMKCHTHLIEYLESMSLFITINWHADLYYSAILSGSIEMMEYTSRKLDVDVTNPIYLDGKQGLVKNGSQIFSTMTYAQNNRTYFSHTINYAIQSKSLAVVEYIHELGYQITASNFITALQQAPVEILEYLCENFDGKLPRAYLIYFSPLSFISNKFEKARIIFESGLLEIGTKFSIDDYQMVSIYKLMITDSSFLAPGGEYDEDYMMMSMTKFDEADLVKLTTVRLALALQMTKLLKELFMEPAEVTTDCLFLYGSITQLKMYRRPGMVPSRMVMMELVCRNQLSKLCYCLQSCELTSQLDGILQTVSLSLQDAYLLSLANRMDNQVSDLLQSLRFSVKSAHLDVITSLLLEMDEVVVDEEIWWEIAEMGVISEYVDIIPVWLIPILVERAERTERIDIIDDLNLCW